jgi:hypothetical protein
VQVLVHAEQHHDLLQIVAKHDAPDHLADELASLVIVCARAFARSQPVSPATTGPRCSGDLGLELPFVQGMFDNLCNDAAALQPFSFTVEYTSMHRTTQKNRRVCSHSILFPGKPPSLVATAHA